LFYICTIVNNNNYKTKKMLEILTGTNYKHTSLNVTMSIEKIEIDKDFETWVHVYISNHRDCTAGNKVFSPKSFKAFLVNYEKM